MSEQGDVAVNPGQAIYDALSDEAKQAVDALPDDVFAGEAGLAAAKLVSASTRMVHELNPNGWLISPDGPTNGRVMLSVIITGTRLLQVLNRSELAIRFDEREINQEVDDWIKSTGFKVDALKTWPTIKRVYVPFKHIDDIPRQFWDAHVAAAKTMNYASWTYGTDGNNLDWHKDAWRVKLALIANKDVPAPAYMPVDRLGLSIAEDEITPAELVSVPEARWLEENFFSAGLTYTDAQISSFYTALQTKGFVILSGISGTGKSKIAQRFVTMLPRPTILRVTDALGHEGIRLQMRPYTKKYNKFVIPQRYEEGLVLPDLGTSREVTLEVDGVNGVGRIEHRHHGAGSIVTAVFLRGQSASAFARMQVDQFLVNFKLSTEGAVVGIIISRIPTVNSNQHISPYPEDVIEARVTEVGLQRRYVTLPLKQATRFPFPELNPSVPILLHLPNGSLEGRLANPMSNVGGRGAEIHFRADADWFLGKLSPGDLVLVRPVVHEGSVTALEIREINDPSAAIGQKQVLQNHLFLPVRPDWRDGKALIGYHNPLTGEYVRTDFLDFVIAASDDFTAGNHNAFFVILDEMNLAHVEYYFADVLSVIESGRDDDGWTVEGIPLAVGEEDADLPEVLRLPPNLYIVGTVNMDETTHPFSPKVLDRAFTIELTEVDFTGYPPSASGDFELSDDEKQALLNAFTQGGRYPRIDKTDIREVVEAHDRFRDDLQSLNTSLRRSRMHFGYRVFDEVMQFVFNAEQNGLFSLDEAFDHAVLMKVPPKFNGSRGKLQTAVFELIHWCHEGGAMEPGDRANLESKFSTLIDEGRPFDSVVIEGEDSVEDNCRYPATGKRAALMMQDLYTDGFASFG